MNGTIGVFIIDSHASVRAGLRALVETEPDMHVVGETGDAALRAGAQGYYLKDGLLENVIGAIRDLYQGKATLHPTVAPAIYRAIRAMTGQAGGRESP